MREIDTKCQVCKGVVVLNGHAPIAALVPLSPAHVSLFRLHFSSISCTVGSLDDFKGVKMTVPHGELIIFDLDGTLVDSVQQIIHSVNKVRVDAGLVARDSKEVFALVGLPPANFFSDLNINESETEELVRDFRSTLEQTEFTSLDIYPYARDLILFLKEKDYSLGIATNKPTQNAKNLLKKVGLLEFFTNVQGSDNLSPKPSPQIIDQVLACIPSTFAVMVGDRIEDIEAARSADIPSIGVSQTAHNQSDLARAGAGLTFSSMKDLFKSISETNAIDTLKS